MPHRHSHSSYRALVRGLLASLIVVLPACSPACFLKPDEPFDEGKLVDRLDYSKPSSWAALPTVEEHTDYIPAGTAKPPSQGRLPADVFYVHPTTWFDKKIWNDNFTSSKSKEILEEITLANQASVFNACCNVYAPRYRQSSISAFFGVLEETEASLDIAYQDVEQAFQYFIDNQNEGRPFIVASHSQGSLHAMRLLGKIDADPALRERLVVAYVPGFKLPMSYYERVYKNLKPCTAPEQLGCVASWDTYTLDAKVAPDEPLVHWFDGKLERVPSDAPRQCTNPITWSMDGERSPLEAHLGAVEMQNDGEPISFIKILMSDDPLGVNITGLKAPRTKMLQAQCVEGVLRVPDVEEFDYTEHETAPGNYHLLDYELFYMDIRANALARTTAWLGKQEPADPPVEQSTGLESVTP